MKHYLIIGTGVAGIAAAEAIRSQDPLGEISLIGDERDGFYSRPGLAYLLSGEIPEKHLYPIEKDDLQKLNAHMMHQRVISVDPQEHQVTLSNGKNISYDRLLLATGSSAAKSPTPGMELEGVVKMDTLEDVRHIIALSKQSKAAVVVGGGITALELVEGLSARGVQTHYFLRSERYWRNVLDETESRIVEHRLKEDGVHLHFKTELDSILGKASGLFGRGKERVYAVRTKDGKILKCGIVAIAIGVRTRKKLAEAAGLKTDRGILVDEYLRASHEDIFAAGDVAQVYDPFTGRAVLDTLWGTARNQGTTAGLNMAGKSTVYVKQVPFNVTRLAGLTTTIIGTVGRGLDDDLLGIARGDSETWRQLPDAIAAQTGFDVNRLRVMIGNDNLIGAIVMGDQTLSSPLYQLIAQHADISNIQDALLTPNAPLSDILVDFWTQWRSQHAA